MSAKDTKMIPPDDSGGGEGVLGCGLEVGVEVGGGGSKVPGVVLREDSHFKLGGEWKT